MEANIFTAEQWNSRRIPLDQGTCEFQSINLDKQIVGVSMKDIWGAGWMPIEQPGGDIDWGFFVPSSDDIERMIDIRISLTVRGGRPINKPWIAKGTKPNMVIAMVRCGSPTRSVQHIVNPPEYRAYSNFQFIKLTDNFNWSTQDYLSLEPCTSLYIGFRFHGDPLPQASPYIAPGDARCIITTLPPAFPDRP